MEFEEILRSNDLKITNSRILLLQIINNLDVDATNKNILEHINVDRSTIYRIIDLFLEKNIIEKNLNYQDEIYYSIKSEHSHYIKCVKCHKKEKIDICPITDLEKKGYTILNHKIEVDGICHNCLTSKKIL